MFGYTSRADTLLASTQFKLAVMAKQPKSMAITRTRNNIESKVDVLVAQRPSQHIL